VKSDSFSALSEPLKTFDDITPTLDSLGVLNMLNMKYVIYNKDAAPLVNPYANGNAWFVNNVRIAADANEEMKLVGEINTKHEMVVDKAFASMVLPKTNAGQHFAYSIKILSSQSFGV